MKNIILILLIALFTVVYMNKQDYIEIPSTSIRLRVIAASDDEVDQKNKRIVKSALTDKLANILNQSTSYDDIDTIISTNIDALNNTIEKTIEENGINSQFSINYGLNYFPEKTYKGVTYNAGNYQSLVVELGDGLGENWWCALYPPLCQIDGNLDEHEYRSLIKDIIDQYN